MDDIGETDEARSQKDGKAEDCRGAEDSCVEGLFWGEKTAMAFLAAPVLPEQQGAAAEQQLITQQ